MTVDLVDQITREQKMFTDGKERYLERQSKNKKIATQKHPHNIISKAIPKVSKALNESLKAELDKSSGRRFSWIKDIKDIDCDLLSFIGLNCCFDAVALNQSFTSCLTKIGHRIELESWALGLKEKDKALANRIETQVIKTHSSERYRIKAAKIIAFKEGYTTEKWSDERKVQAGSPIINAIMEHSDVFDTWSQRGKYNNTIKRVGLTTEASTLIAKLEYEDQWAEPMLAPMIVPPNDWEAPDTGCYIDKVTASHVPLIRKNPSNTGAWRSQIKTVEHQLKTEKELPEYIEALNMLQSTKLKINSTVVDAVSWCWNENKHLGKFPIKDHLQLKQRPGNWDEMDSYAKKGWTIDARNIREKNREIDGARANMAQDLKTANELAGYEEFYIPWNFDFRGRVYPVTHFCYHRDDHIKAMFEFKEGCVLNEESKWWLAVHIANLGDFNKISKQPLEKRVDWVLENEERILAVGKSFEDSFDYWKEADKPFQFLAACVEWYQASLDSNYISGLPIALDGTISGIQHFAASSLDERDGYNVNLVPSEKPQDLYQKVADLVNEKLKADISNSYACLWLKYGVGRSEVKRNTMTWAYSSKAFGMKEQLVEDLMKPLQKDVDRKVIDNHPFGSKIEQSKAASYLAKINYDCISSLIKSAQSGMEFFQSIASILSEENKEIAWKTPVGFPVVQKYCQWDTKRVRPYLYDRAVSVQKRSQVSIRKRNDYKVNKRKNKAAISPNVIHSLDAAHLLSTIIVGKDNGIKNFFVIHDSFATLPDQTWNLFHCVRRSFIEQYKDWCMYDDFLYQTKQLMKNPSNPKIPDIPDKGDLILEDIMKSDYCFS
jgi:DNA-directed RNA polymerase, mitochondrial